MPRSKKTRSQGGGVLTLPSPPRAVHKTHRDLMGEDAPVKIALAGCGGNGAQMLTKLARLDYALRELGRPGLEVIAYDPDTVTRSNVGRQMFSPADVGQFKAAVLVNRINAFYGTAWQAVAGPYEGAVPSWMRPGTFSAPDILVSCVDTAKARRQMHRRHDGHTGLAPTYWLDLGNQKDSGQVILGQPAECYRNKWHDSVGTVPAGQVGRQPVLLTPLQARLPTVMEVFPELLNSRRREDNNPSCSVAEALTKQSLFVNDAMATFAAQLLDDLLRRGELDYHGAFINLATGRVNALPVPQPVAVALPNRRQRAA